MKHHSNQGFVVDSSVFAKLFLEESDREKAVKFFDESVSKHYQICVPSIFIYEILNICAVKKFNEETVFALLDQHQKFGLQIMNPSEKLLRGAIKLTKIGHSKSGYPSLYDCIYHALAIELGCNFITSDSKHFAKTKQLGSIKLLKDYA